MIIGKLTQVAKAVFKNKGPFIQSTVCGAASGVRLPSGMYEADKVPSSVPRLQARAAAAYSWGGGGGGVLYLL